MGVCLPGGARFAVKTVTACVALVVLAMVMAPRAFIAPAFADELLPRVHLVPGQFTPGTQPDGNSVGLEAPGGLIIIDTGRHPEHAQNVIDLAGEVQAPIVAVINTHWHLDHIGGNPLIRRAFPRTRVYASRALDAAMNGFLADYRTQVEGALATADSAGAPPLRAELAILNAGRSLAPDEVITSSGSRVIAGRRLVIGLCDHAVTAADLWVYDPAARVLVAGDLVTLPVPFFDTACPRGWQAALWRISTLDFRILIPGHGAPMNRRSFELYRNAFENLLASARTDSVSREACISGWIEDAGPLLSSTEHDAARAMLGYYIDNVLRGDAARRDRDCGD